MMTEENKKSIVRNLIFGIQDSFGSTVGFLSGIAVSGVTKEVLILSGVVLICVEAFSMGIGSVISDHTVEEYTKKKSLPLFKSLSGGLVMFVSYLLAGLVPLSPYILFWGKNSVLYSITATIVFLIILGYVSAKIFKISPLHHIKEMLIVGVFAIAVGVFIGKIFPGV